MSREELVWVGAAPLAADEMEKLRRGLVLQRTVVWVPSGLITAMLLLYLFNLSLSSPESIVALSSALLVGLILGRISGRQRYNQFQNALLEGLDIAPKAVRCNQWNQLYYAIETFLPGKHESNSDQNVPILLQTATEIHQVHSDRCGHLGRLNHCSWSAYVHDMARGNERHFLEKVPDQKYIGCVLTGYPEAANFSLLHGDL